MVSNNQQQQPLQHPFLNFEKHYHNLKNRFTTTRTTISATCTSTVNHGDDRKQQQQQHQDNSSSSLTQVRKQKSRPYYHYYYHYNNTDFRKYEPQRQRQQQQSIYYPVADSGPHQNDGGRNASIMSRSETTDGDTRYYNYEYGHGLGRPYNAHSQNYYYSARSSHPYTYLRGGKGGGREGARRKKRTPSTTVAAPAAEIIITNATAGTMCPTRATRNPNQLQPENSSIDQPVQVDAAIATKVATTKVVVPTTHQRKRKATTSSTATTNSSQNPTHQLGRTNIYQSAAAAGVVGLVTASTGAATSTSSSSSIPIPMTSPLQQQKKKKKTEQPKKSTTTTGSIHASITATDSSVEMTTPGSTSTDNQNNLNCTRTTTIAVDDAAICDWIQCENPQCLKWRKVPVNIDISHYSNGKQRFVCSEINSWTATLTIATGVLTGTARASSISCHTPEDDWQRDNVTTVAANYDYDNTNKNRNEGTRVLSKNGILPVEVYRGKPTESLVDIGLDHWPEGWIKILIQRQSGKFAGKSDRYWYTPKQHFKLRSMVEIKQFLIALRYCNNTGNNNTFKTENLNTKKTGNGGDGGSNAGGDDEIAAKRIMKSIDIKQTMEQQRIVLKLAITESATVKKLGMPTPSTAATATPIIVSDRQQKSERVTNHQ